MDNENKVVTPQGEQDQEIEITLDGTEDVDALKAKYETAQKQILARAKRAEAELKQFKSSQKTEVEKPTTAPAMDEVYDLRFDGYNRDEVAFIMKNGGRSSLEKDPFVKKAVELMREQRKAEQGVPGNDSSKSDIEKKYTPEQLRNMPVEELLKVLPHSNR
jgi:hypothetical protein